MAFPSLKRIYSISAPAECPVCKAPADKFVKQEGEMTWAAEHVIGVAADVSDDIKEDLRANFNVLSVIKI